MFNGRSRDTAESPLCAAWSSNEKGERKIPFALPLKFPNRYQANAGFRILRRVANAKVRTPTPSKPSEEGSGTACTVKISPASEKSPAE